MSRLDVLGGVLVKSSLDTYKLMVVQLEMRSRIVMSGRVRELFSLLV